MISGKQGNHKLPFMLTTTSTMYPNTSSSLLTILFTIVSIVSSISCVELAKPLEKVDNVTISVYQVSVADTYVTLKIYAPITYMDDYIERFDITYQLVRPNGQSESKTEPSAIESLSNQYTVKVTDLEPDSRYIINVNAIFGSNMVSKYSMAAYEKDIEVNTQLLAPQSSVTKELLLKFEANNVRFYNVHINKINSVNELVPMMHATVYPQMGNTLPLQLIAGERYSIKIWYEDKKGKIAAISEKIYSM